jgi:DNA repair protein RAD5
MTNLVGMGKTIMLSALIQMNHGPDLDGPDENAENKKGRQLKLKHAFRAVHNAGPSKGPSATLIVAPTSLLSQWSEELKRSSKPGTFKILVWHGQNRLDLEAAIADDHEDDKAIKVVVTSYGVLASEHAKSEKSNSHQSPVFGSKVLACEITQYLYQLSQLNGCELSQMKHTIASQEAVRRLGPYMRCVQDDGGQ